MDRNGIGIRQNRLVMRIMGQGDGRKLVVLDPYVGKAFYIVEFADDSGCPVFVTKDKGIIVVFYPSFKIVKMKLYLIAAAKPENGIGSLVTSHKQLWRPDNGG